MNIEQGSLIQSGDWDYLIVLDACRYDFFKRQINDFFKGELIKTTSAGSCTLDWCLNTFNATVFRDVVYISSNPFINSRKELRGFQASKVFKKVIDVWLDGWDDDLGTVPPSKVTEAAKQALESKAQKVIIHYLQPHAPYLVDRYKTMGFSEPFIETTNFLSILNNRNSESGFKRIIVSKTSPRVRAKIKTLYLYYLQLLRKPPYSPIDDTRRRFGVKGLRDAYSLNLSTVLEEVCKIYQKILDYCPEARVVITSDHGEALGEGREYGHMCGRKTNILLTVPWFKVDRVLKPAHTDN